MNHDSFPEIVRAVKDFVPVLWFVKFALGWFMFSLTVFGLITAAFAVERERERSDRSAANMNASPGACFLTGLGAALAAIGGVILLLKISRPLGVLALLPLMTRIITPAVLTAATSMSRRQVGDARALTTRDIWLGYFVLQAIGTFHLLGLALWLGWVIPAFGAYLRSGRAVVLPVHPSNGPESAPSETRTLVADPGEDDPT